MAYTDDILSRSQIQLHEFPSLKNRRNGAVSKKTLIKPSQASTDDARPMRGSVSYC